MKEMSLGEAMMLRNDIKESLSKASTNCIENLSVLDNETDEDKKLVQDKYSLNLMKVQDSINFLAELNLIIEKANESNKPLLIKLNSINEIVKILENIRLNLKRLSKYEIENDGDKYIKVRRILSASPDKIDEDIEKLKQNRRAIERSLTSNNATIRVVVPFVEEINTESNEDTK